MDESAFQHQHNQIQIFKRIAFFGDAQTPKSDPEYKEAFAVAKLLAEQGLVIVNGGGPGIMDASTQGAEAAGGETIAVTFSPKEAGSFEGRYLKNLAKVDKEVVTNNYIARMFALIENSDMFVIFKGGSGTLSEFGTVWVLSNIYHGHHKPFILYGGFWWEIIDTLYRTMNIDEQEMDCFRIVESPDAVLEAIRQFEWKMGKIDHTRCKVCGERAFMT
jgi:uncharacterized protein (TIGR00730 family)